MKKWLFRGVVGAVVLLVSYQGLDWLSRQSGSLPPVPAPNGYEQVLALARQLETSSITPAEMKPQQLAALDEKNRLLVEKIHQALALDSRVPLRAEPDWMTRHVMELVDLRGLSMIFALRAEGFRQMGDARSALACDLDVLRLANTLERGGLIIDGVNAMAMQETAREDLRADLPHLDAASCQQAARALEELEVRKDTPGLIVEREDLWAAKSDGLLEKIGRVIIRDLVATQQQSFARNYLHASLNDRELLLRLAVRASELETGTPVTNAATLVPKYLKAVPLDPWSQTELTLPGGT